MDLWGVPNAVGTWTVTVIDAKTVDLQGSIWAGLFGYTGGTTPAGLPTYQPTIDRVLQISAITNNGSNQFRIKTSIPHTYESGTNVNIPAPGPVGSAGAVGQWIISVPTTLPVTGAVNNGSGLIRLTVTGGNYKTGDKVQVLNVGGVPNANGWWIVTAISPTVIDLQGSSFFGSYTSGGGATFTNVNVFDLVNSTFAGSYISGGTVLQYFAGVLAQTIAIGTSFQSYKLRAFPSGDLRIKNATIQLTATAGQILLSPSAAQITLTSNTTLAEIVLDGTVPSLTFYDQTGQADVTLEILNELPPLSVTGVTIASMAPGAVLTVPGNTYVNGDTVIIAGATSNPVLNGYRIVENVNSGAGTFTLTNLQGNPIYTSTGESGTVKSTRYYAGLLAQSLALGGSWGGYRLRFFADGTLKINNAAISASTITNSTVGVTNLTSVGGTAPNTVTLTITNGIMTIVGSGSAAGTGTITIDGLSTMGYLSFVGKSSAPTAPGAGFADIYYDTSLTGLYYNLGGAGWLPLGVTPPAGSNTQIQFNNGGNFGASGNLTWNGGVLQTLGLQATGITVTSTGISVSSGNVAIVTGVLVVQGNTGFTGTLAAAITASKNVIGGIIY
jgi:hypothetical protein